MNLEQLKELFEKGPTILYPFDAMELIKEIKVGKVFPVTNRINDQIIPGLLISCDAEICAYYEITYPPPTPNLKFRMADLGRTDFLIEVILFFQKGKIMKLHLDPSNKIVKHYLKMVMKTHMASFHFYKQESRELIDSYTNLNEEEQSWFSRNYELARKLKINKKFNQLSKMIEAKKMDGSDERVFEFHPVLSKKVLAEHTAKFVKMGDARHFFDGDDG